MCVSLLGDGAFLVAIAWQVYELSNTPTAMSVVGIAMTVPTILFLLLGGVASDRFERRRIMIGADVLRAAAGLALAWLALTGALEVWHACRVRGDVRHGRRLLRAGLRRGRPGHRAVRTAGTGQCARSTGAAGRVPHGGPRTRRPAGRLGRRGRVFALDSASFVFSAAVLCRVRVDARPERGQARSVARDLAEGWRFVRRRAWLWATFASAAVAYLCFMGPVEVLLPYLVKNDLEGSARDLGMVFAAGGIGSVTCALAMGQRDIPRRSITFIYASWTLATLAVAGYGLSSSMWQLMLAAPRLQRPRDGRHDRLGDAEAAARASQHARPSVEHRLADLDRPAAALIRAHRTGRRGDRNPRDAGRRRGRWRGRDGSRLLRSGDAGGRASAGRGTATAFRTRRRYGLGQNAAADDRRLVALHGPVAEGEVAAPRRVRMRARVTSARTHSSHPGEVFLTQSGGSPIDPSAIATLRAPERCRPRSGLPRRSLFCFWK